MASSIYAPGPVHASALGRLPVPRDRGQHDRGTSGVIVRRRIAGGSRGLAVLITGPLVAKCQPTERIRCEFARLRSAVVAKRQHLSAAGGVERDADVLRHREI